MKRGRTESETCQLNGWTVGTVLEGDEGYGPERIKITAIGESNILAKRIQKNGEPDVLGESLWTLRYREWKTVT